MQEGLQGGRCAGSLVRGRRLLARRLLARRAGGTQVPLHPLLPALHLALLALQLSQPPLGCRQLGISSAGASSATALLLAAAAGAGLAGLLLQPLPRLLQLPLKLG